MVSTSSSVFFKEISSWRFVPCRCESGYIRTMTTVRTTLVDGQAVKQNMAQSWPRACCFSSIGTIYYACMYIDSTWVLGAHTQTTVLSLSKDFAWTNFGIEPSHYQVKGPHKGNQESNTCRLYIPRSVVSWVQLLVAQIFGAFLINIPNNPYIINPIRSIYWTSSNPQN